MTNTVVNIPAISIQLPFALDWGNTALTIVSAVVAAKGGAKLLDGFEVKYPWLSPIVVALEHISLKQDVTPLADRSPPQAPPAVIAAAPTKV